MGMGVFRARDTPVLEKRQSTGVGTMENRPFKRYPGINRWLLTHSGLVHLQEPEQPEHAQRLVILVHLPETCQSLGAVNIKIHLNEIVGC